ncbi:MAG TPA: hypothetical protein VLZ89_10190 [Anaerolineales bacterium]|nr:hypothetical protein [Anaerolineales bacterium]
MNPFQGGRHANFAKEVPIPEFLHGLKPRRAFILAAPGILLVITAYVWLISFGSWSKWPTTTNYYNQLATAFEHGSFSLETKPKPALLALPDPYDPGARAGIDFLKDASLYHGRYYLYFGPIPALILAAFKRWVPGQPGDQYLAFAGVSGMFLVQSMLILKIWGRFFQSISVWLLVMCILFAGLISPVTWILTQARIYEAAASSGQFFFLAGFYLIVIALEQRSSGRKSLLFLAGGTLWALAIGSRLTQILPVGFMIVTIAFLSVKTYRQNRELLQAVVPMELLGGPVVLGMAVLGRYNWARFHSIFETGLSYQLAGPNLQKYSHVLFSPLYILPDLYNYLAAPPHLHGIFPFVAAIPGSGAAIFSYVPLPPVYYNTPLTGLLFSTPFVLCAGLSVASLARRGKSAMLPAEPAGSSYPFKWLIAGLLGSWIFGFAPFVSFFWVAPHYQTDFTPCLVILSIIGFWQGCGFMARKPEAVHKLYVAAGMALMAASILIGILLAFSAHAAQFQQSNPVLWKQLLGLFSR